MTDKDEKDFKVVNFRMDRVIWRQLKARCALKGRSLQSVMVQLVDEYLKRNLEV